MIVKLTSEHFHGAAVVHVQLECEGPLALLVRLLRLDRAAEKLNQLTRTEILQHASSAAAILLQPAINAEQVARLVKAQEDLRTPDGALRLEGVGVLQDPSNNAPVSVLIGFVPPCVAHDLRDDHVLCPVAEEVCDGGEPCSWRDGRNARDVGRHLGSQLAFILCLDGGAHLGGHLQQPCGLYVCLFVKAQIVPRLTSSGPLGCTAGTWIDMGCGACVSCKRVN